MVRCVEPELLRSVLLAQAFRSDPPISRVSTFVEAVAQAETIVAGPKIVELATGSVDQGTNTVLAFIGFMIRLRSPRPLVRRMRDHEPAEQLVGTVSWRIATVRTTRGVLSEHDRSGTTGALVLHTGGNIGNH